MYLFNVGTMVLIGQEYSSVCRAEIVAGMVSVRASCQMSTARGSIGQMQKLVWCAIDPSRVVLCRKIVIFTVYV